MMRSTIRRADTRLKTFSGAHGRATTISDGVSKTKIAFSACVIGKHRRCLSNILFDAMSRISEASRKLAHCRLVQVQEMFSRFWRFYGPQKGTNCSIQHHPLPILRSLVAWASAPTRRATFASTKVAHNRLPTVHPVGFPHAKHLHRDVGKTRPVCIRPQTCCRHPSR